MGRIRLNIESGTKKHWGLFDTGARNTNIIKSISKGFPMANFSKPKEFVEF